MQDFSGKIAVITGGGTGMGRALAAQLVSEGCDVAMCDISSTNLDRSLEFVKSAAPQGVRVSGYVADVSLEPQMNDWAKQVQQEFETDHINLLFNNAGIAGGGSMIADSRANWELTFNVCWHGVYYGVRAFLPLLLKSNEGHVINTSSVNGFWASIGENSAHTAYSAAKFAVKGFTEALINDFRLNAPHLKASVVMPGHIGTSIVLNSVEVAKQANDNNQEGALQRMIATETVGEDAATAVQEMGERFRDDAPTTSEQAAKIILDGVKAERWRILVGDDAHRLDEGVRADPENAYEPGFIDGVFGSQDD